MSRTFNDNELRRGTALQQGHEEVYRAKEWLRVTLASIGDGVITTDTDGKVLTLNGVAQELTGWTEQEAQGRPLGEVFRIVNEDTRAEVENPGERALREGRVVGLANHTVLVAKNGQETPIDDSAAPIRDDHGKVQGVVLIFRSIAERRQAEIASARLAAIIESSNDAIISKTLDGIVRSWNAAAERLFGYHADEIIGRSITLIIPPERQDEEKMILDRVRRGERTEHYETVRVAKDGRAIHVSLTISPIHDRDGRIIGASKISRDITERKRAEQRLATQHAITRALAEGPDLGEATARVCRAVCEYLNWQAGVLWMVDAHAGVLRCRDVYHPPGMDTPHFTAVSKARTFERGIGLPGRVWQSSSVHSIDDVVGDENFPRAAAADMDHLHAAIAFPILMRADVVGVLEFYAREARVPDPELLDILMAVGSQIGQFIERKQAEESLRASEQRTRFLADASAALAELTDYESTLQKVAALAAPHFADWCSVDMQDADGSLRRLAVTHVDPEKVKLVYELERKYPPREQADRGARLAIRTGEPNWMATIPEELLVAAAQSEEHLRILRELGLRSYICVPLKSRSGVLGALTFVTAESGRLYREDDVRAAEDLAHRAVIAIENAKLLAALKDADRRKDEFLAMLAHELRNPLAPIRNAAQIVQAKAPPLPELQWATEVIERQVHQMSRIVDDLLDLSRITRGKIELRKERIDLADVVNSAVEASRPLIDKWEHQFTVSVPPRPIYLHADPTRLAQVILNLLNNAAKYTHQGGRIALEVRTNDGFVSISVRDNGIGIAADMLPRVFEMFTQVDRSMERSEGGLGIGLTLVQRLVEMHGGSVEARSDGPGKGSEFIIRLPIASAVEKKHAQGKETKDGAPKLRRILVVDDNRDAADTLGMLLRVMGNQVHTAHDGIEAVGAASAFRPDVVLLDIGLPRLNGYEVARRIRSQPDGANMLLIALTGWGQDEDRRKSKEAGFDHHLTKPVEFAALQKLLAEFPER